MKHSTKRAYSFGLAALCMVMAMLLSAMVLLQGIQAQASSDSYLKYTFYDNNGNILSTLSGGTKIGKLVLVVQDLNLDSTSYDYVAAKAAMSAAQSAVDAAKTAWDAAPSNSALETAYDNAVAAYNSVAYKCIINTDNFRPANNSKVTFSDSANPLTSGAEFTVTITNLEYTGKNDRLVVSIDCPGTTSIAPPGNPMPTWYFSETIALLNVNSYVERPNRDDDDDDDDSSSSRIEIAPPTPSIIVDSFDYGGENIQAASNFDVQLNIKNTSDKLPIDNIVMKVTVPEAFTLNGSTNTFYFDKMEHGAIQQCVLNLSAKPNAEPISHAIKISFSYETVIMKERKQYTAEQEISIPVGQLTRFGIGKVEVPSEIIPGEEADLSISLINRGKTEVYNVAVEITGNIKQPGQQQFIGNLEGGKQATAEFIVDALEGGPVGGELIITYEDANMNVKELRANWSGEALATDMEMGEFPPDMDAGMDMPPPDEAAASQPWYLMMPVWGWVVAGIVLVIGGAFTIKVIIANHKKKLEGNDEDF